MNVYQLLKQFVAEVERTTGVTPRIQVSLHSHGELTDEECESIRNIFATDCNGELQTENSVYCDQLKEWNAYSVGSYRDDIQVTVFGPKTEVAHETA